LREEVVREAMAVGLEGLEASWDSRESRKSWGVFVSCGRFF